MKDQDKTKRQLIDELAKLRQKIIRLEKSESRNKATEKSLRESEEKYRTIIDSIDEDYYESAKVSVCENQEQEDARNVQRKPEPHQINGTHP